MFCSGSNRISLFYVYFQFQFTWNCIFRLQGLFICLVFVFVFVFCFLFFLKHLDFKFCASCVVPLHHSKAETAHRSPCLHADMFAFLIYTVIKSLHILGPPYVKMWSNKLILVLQVLQAAYGKKGCGWGKKRWKILNH